jgi:uncharacterized membrane protein YdjX (TVP38/TMEM64 family)
MKVKLPKRDGNAFAFKVITVIALIILFAAAIVYVVTQASLLQWDEQKLKGWVESLGTLAPLMTIGLMVLHSFLPVPGEIVAVLNGVLFGPVWGVIYTWIGAMIGAYLSFFLSKKWGQPIVRWLFPSLKVEQLPFWQSVHSSWTLLLMRLIPLISFNLINYALGLSSISLWRYTWTTAIGILPGIILSVVFGDSLASANKWLTAALGGVLLIVFIMVWVRKRSQRN